MEKKLRSKLKNLQSSYFKLPILLIHYNRLVPDALKKGDDEVLMSFLDLLDIKSAIIILYGNGGSTKTGIYLAQLLRKKLDYFEVFVPGNCCSALIYPIITSDKLILTNNSYLTQIDPVEVTETSGTEERIRVIKALRSDSELNSKINAGAVFKDFTVSLQSMIKEKKSLFDHKYESYLTDEEEFSKIISLFLNKESHSSEVTYSDLKDMNFKVKKLEEIEPNSSQEIIMKVKEILCYAQEILGSHEGNLLLSSSLDFKQHKDKNVLIRTKTDLDRYESNFLI